MQHQLPGFRFHPTEEELLEFYLKKMVFGKKVSFDIIRFLNIYHHDPWDLPELAKIGEREWYFFVQRDRKHGNGGRPNRTTEHGFWKATGSDRQIRSLSDPKRIIGLRKTLVFYKGRAPRGSKTDWVMNEYRLPETCNVPKPKEDIVLCKIYRKATSLKELEQRAAMEKEIKTTTHVDAVSFAAEQQQKLNFIEMETNEMVFKIEEEEMKEENERETSWASSSLLDGFVKANLPELQLPKVSMDWMQDPFWKLDNWTPYANVLSELELR